VQITNTLIAIINHTVGSRRIMRMYLRLETRTMTIAKKVKFLIRITLKGKTSLTSVFSLLLKKSSIT
jgi:hypothetical protein